MRGMTAALSMSVSLVATTLLSAQQPSHTVAVDDATRSKTAAAEARLNDVVSLTLDRVPLRTAIDSLAATANVTVLYQTAMVTSVARPVTLHAVRMRLRDAFSRVLDGTALQLVSLPGGQFSIIPLRDATRMAGGLAGTVTDRKTTRPVPHAEVVLDDSVSAVRTDETGRYRFPVVTAGAHRITVRAIGFSRQSRMVTVADNATVTADFALAATVNTLDQVVVTATGQQRIRELGHVVTQLNVDSLVQAAPITNMTELLQSRVPGLQVITGDGGVAGGEIALRIRGTSTRYLNPEPIVIVDGVRYHSNNLTSAGASSVMEDVRGNNGELQSPLNDINPNDIATIEVVKGPSASTLYGPDAANGVIVITTKRGAPGSTKFQWYARPVTSSIPKDRISTGYQIWSHDASGATYTQPCSLQQQYELQRCTLDSITVSKPLATDNQYSMLAKSRPTWLYGASLSGGVTQLQYFLSGNYTSQMGMLQVSPAVQTYLKQQLGAGALSDAVKNPNTLNVIGGHSAFSANPSPKTTLGLTVDYTQTNHRMAQPGIFFTQYNRGALQPGQDTANLADIIDNPSFSLRTSEELTGHFKIGSTGTFEFLPWWSFSGTLGLDLTDAINHAVTPAIASPGDQGGAQEDRRSNTDRNANLSSTAMAHAGLFSFRTTLGTDYVYDHLDGVTINGNGLAPGSTSFGTLANKSVYQEWTEAVTLGTFGEEIVGFRDRLFVTGSLRYDGSSTFGDSYHPRPYPKVGLSWIASEEPVLRNMPGLRELRFRGSYGAASNYPTSVMKLGTQYGYGTTVEGESQNIFVISALANPDLRPERSHEFEYGSDITIFNNIAIGLTWSRRRTDDQLYVLNNTGGLYQSWVNVGNMRASNFEATVDVPVYDAHNVRANLGFSYSYHEDKVLSLTGVPEYKDATGSSLAAGYPIGSVFGQPVIGAVDTVGNTQDGIVFSNEVVTDSVVRFLGVVTPPKTFTLTPTLD